MATVKVKCKDCGKDFERPVQRGRPATRCEACRNVEASPPPKSSKESRYLPPKESSIDILDIIASPPSSSSILAEPTITEMVEINVEFFQYYVMVSNMGIAFKTNSKEVALQKFNEYVKKSNVGFGQVGCENVRLYQLNPETKEYETLKDFIYTKD